MSLSQPAKSIAGLRVYQASRTLEDSIYELAKLLPASEFYLLSDDLRRSSAAISHYITEYHRRHSYGIKLEAINLARLQTEELKRLLASCTERGFGDTTKLQHECTTILKQSWGLVRYIKGRQQQRQQQIQITASEQLVAARA